MTDLSGFSAMQLQAELEKRGRGIPAKPSPREVNNLPLDELNKLRAMCIENVETLAEKGYEPKDIEHYIYEQAMKLVYGPDIWDFINAVLD